MQKGNVAQGTARKVASSTAARAVKAGGRSRHAGSVAMSVKPRGRTNDVVAGGGGRGGVTTGPGTPGHAPGSLTGATGRRVDFAG